MDFPKHPKIQQNEKGDLFLNFGDYGQEVEAACFSGDGKRVLTVQEVGIARIWDVASNSLIAELQPASPLEGLEDKAPVKGGFQVFIEAAALNTGGSLALLGLNDGTARLYSIDTGEELSILSEPGKDSERNWSVIRAVNFSPDGSLALVGFFSRSVGVWNVGDKSFVRLLSGQYGNRLFKKPFVRDTMTSSVSITADNRYVFAGFADMTAAVWDLKSGETVFAAYEHIEKILDLWQREKVIRWATSGGTVYEAHDFEPARKVLETGESWEEVKFSPSGAELLTRSITGSVEKWTLSGESEYFSEAGNLFSYDAVTLAWGSDEKTFVYIRDGRSVVISDGTDQVIVKKGQIIGQVVFLPENDLITANDWSKLLEIWSASNGEKIQTLVHQDSISRAVFSSDGKMIAAGCLGHGGPGEIRPIYVWDTRSGERIADLNGHTHQVFALGFDPNGDWLVSASLDRTVRFWELKESSARSPFGTDRLYYDDLEFHSLEVLRDGRVIIFRDGLLEIWRDGRKITIPFPPEYKIKWLINDDESYITGAFNNQILRKWNLQSGEDEQTVQANIFRPEFLPSNAPKRHPEKSFKPQAGAYLWRTKFGNFIHTGDGPRGWVTPLTDSEDGNFVIIPGEDQAALIDVSQSQNYISFFPFKGRLRANCILPDKILLLNSIGEVFINERV